MRAAGVIAATTLALTLAPIAVLVARGSGLAAYIGTGGLDVPRQGLLLAAFITGLVLLPIAASVTRAIALALFVGGAVWYYRSDAARARDSVPPTTPAQS